MKVQQAQNDTTVAPCHKCNKAAQDAGSAPPDEIRTSFYLHGLGGCASLRVVVRCDCDDLIYSQGFFAEIEVSLNLVSSKHVMSARLDSHSLSILHFNITALASYVLSPMYKIRRKLVHDMFGGCTNYRGQSRQSGICSNAPSQAWLARDLLKPTSWMRGS